MPPVPDPDPTGGTIYIYPSGLGTPWDPPGRRDVAIEGKNSTPLHTIMSPPSKYTQYSHFAIINGVNTLMYSK